MPKHPSRVNRTAVWLAVMLLALVAGSRVARAGEADAPEQPQTSWYGWQTLLVDGGWIGLWMLGLAVDHEKYGSSSPENYQLGANVLFTSAVATYVLGGPAIHLAHGHADSALGSLALRVGFPLAGALAGYALGSAACGSNDSEFIPCPVAIGALGFMAGFVAAPIIDASVVARETVAPPTGPRFQAAFVPSGGGGRFVLGGRF